LVPQFDGAIYEGIFPDVCFFRGPKLPVTIIPVQVAWSL